MLRPEAGVSGPRTLIVGADGEIATALCQSLTARGWPVVTTSRRGTPGALPLDLSADPVTWPALPAADAAVVCAGFSNIAACMRDPAGSARVNVTATAALAERLAGQGTRVLFLSSNQVFDGALPRRARSDAPCPVSEYGRQKVRTEETVLGLGARGTVLRLTKVLTPALKLLRDWRAALARGGAVTPFPNFPLAPVPLSLVVETATAILRDGASGLFHCSSADDVTYVALAESLARRFGFDAGLVRPTDVQAATLGFDWLPAYSSLEMVRESTSLGIKPPMAAQVIDGVVAAL